MRTLFNLLAGKKDYAPYEYQERVANYILKGKNLLLCAPTGAGKTWAALLPFLFSWKKATPIVDRLIYVLPLRSLATSLYNETIMSCASVFKVKKNPEERNGEADEIVITIQTGDQKDDPFFEGDIIFTTVDQCLSSYINMPVSLPRRVGNINAGALLGSLIVLDEFHLLEPDKAMQTAIEMLSRLKQFSNFIIMTATLSAKSMEVLNGLLGGEIIRLPEQEVLALPSHSDKKRTFRWVNHVLKAKDIIQSHQGGRSIVIINTVVRAQEIFWDLNEYASRNGIKLFLLHSRFYPEDRKKTEDGLNHWFGKNANLSNTILVTTQVIEAGIDISADNLHTELAPLNSIIQRAGRCARYAGNRGAGTVWVYELQKDDSGKVRLGAYRDQSVVIRETRKMMELLVPGGEIISFSSEQEWINQVHTEQECSYLQSYTQNIHQLKRKVHEAMDGKNPAAVRNLIRDIASVSVIITDRPEELRFDKKEWPQMLSVPRSSLYRLKDFFSGIIDETWVAKLPMEGDDDQAIMHFEWQIISSIDEAVNAPWLVVIHPEYASYSQDIGLQIGVSGSFRPPKYHQRPLISGYSIQYETYAEHVHRALKVCRSMHPYYRNALSCLQDYYDKRINGKPIEKFVELACVLHDTGKLSIKWQEAVQAWQKHKNSSKLTDAPIAHSDYDPENDFEEKKSFSRQPPHAAEGAYAVARWLNDCMDNDVALVLWTAITRHHGAFTDSLGSFKLIDGAAQWIQKDVTAEYSKSITLDDAPDIVMRKEYVKKALLSFSKNADDEDLWPLYVFFVRRVRLADQKSQQGG